MSVVTNLLVTFHHEESDDVVRGLLAWFDDQRGILNLAEPDLNDHWGGQKNPEVEHLWAGAYNHLDLDALWRHLRSLRWEYPDLVQVFVKEQWDLRFQVWMLRNGAFAQLADGAAWGGSAER